MKWHNAVSFRAGGPRKRRTALLAVTAMAAVALAVASTAYACTTINGQTTVSESSVQNNGTLTVGGSGALASTTYQIRFLNYVSEQDSMNTCMSGLLASHPDYQLGASVTSDGSGNFTTVSRTLPADGHPGLGSHAVHASSTTSSPQGPASVCHKTSNESDATNDALVTIL